MKRIQYGFALVLAVALFASCGKENPASPQYGSVLYYNASPTKLTDQPMRLYVNDSSISTNFVLFGQSSGYVGVLPDADVSVAVKQEPTPPSTSPVTVTSQSVAMALNQAYTMVSYDSLSGNSLKSVLLRDDLTVPSVDSAKVRFWLLSPNFPSASVHEMDVTYLRTSVTPNDSVTITNRVYPGANPVATDMETFRTIPSGTYTIKLKTVGTQTVLTQVTPVTVARRRIVSHALIGGVNGRALAFGSVTHF